MEAPREIKYKANRMIYVKYITQWFHFAFPPRGAVSVLKMKRILVVYIIQRYRLYMHTRVIILWTQELMNVLIFLVQFLEILFDKSII